MKKAIGFLMVSILMFSGVAFAAKGTVILRGIRDCGSGTSTCVYYDGTGNTRLSRIVGEECAVDVENQTPTQQASAIRTCAAAQINSADPSQNITASNLNIQ